MGTPLLPWTTVFDKLFGEEIFPDITSFWSAGVRCPVSPPSFLCLSAPSLQNSQDTFFRSGGHRLGLAEQSSPVLGVSPTPGLWWDIKGWYVTQHLGALVAWQEVLQQAERAWFLETASRGRQTHSKVFSSDLKRGCVTSASAKLFREAFGASAAALGSSSDT